MPRDRFYSWVICPLSSQRDLFPFEDLGPDAASQFVALTSGGDTGGSITLTTAVGDSNLFHDIRRGGAGADGRDGFGINLGLFTIGVEAGNGTAGGAGPSFSRTIAATHGLIQSVSNNLLGIVVASRGGDGGEGGNSFLSLGVAAGDGGSAGAGGNVTATNFTDIVTNGANSHGMFVYSRSGDGGYAGDVIIGLASGGTGGAGGGGGTAIGINHGSITTRGAGAIGLLVQSLGGASGDGGGSFGLVGIPGNTLGAGSGGSASATNYGAITTYGTGAHGVAAQSIGGSGGQAGASVGIVALGNARGGTGGNGGSATAINGDGGTIETHGLNAFGLVAQSIGGGGGDGSFAAGLVALGSSGGAAGGGGSAVAHQLGNASIITHNHGGFGIFAQSIGGGGGNGGVGGGLAGIGGGGAGGGNSGTVTVTT